MSTRRSNRGALLRRPVTSQFELDLLQAQLDRLLDVGTQLEGTEILSGLEALMDERSWSRAMIDQVPDMLYAKDLESTFLIANGATAAGKIFRGTGEPATTETLVGRNDFDLFPRAVAQKFRDIEVRIMQSGKPMIGMHELNVDGAGRSRWIVTTKVPIRNHKGKVIGLIGIGRDETARKEAEDQVQFLAHHDPLTGLPNRALFADRLGQAILHATRRRQPATVVFLDLDRFKLVNDSLGHLAGDEVLKIAADRMVSCLRATDTVARLGGDEFVILLSDPPLAEKGIVQVIEKLRTSVARPIEISAQRFRVSASIGVASFPDDGQDPETLMANADAAMYHAKELGRDNYQFYTAALSASATERLSFAEDLRRALANDEFVLHYQPQIDLETGRIFAVEALVRWQHPVLGMLQPGDFIPLAEETGLIVPIGRWVLETACVQNARWQEDGMVPITVSVNVSARQFADKDLVEHVKAALEKSGLGARYLDIELTESMIMQDLHRGITTMKELEALGTKLSIDDFGTGYSSLSALKSFPINRLKIDQSFIKGLSSGEDDDRAIAAAVISLGQKLKLRVIAEGVETEQQLAFLRQNGCDEVQGFHFSKPIKPDDLANLLERKPPQLP